MIKRYQVRGFDLHEYECDGGIWCRWSDVEPIIKENDELRKWLDGSKLIIANMMPKEIADAE